MNRKTLIPIIAVVLSSLWTGCSNSGKEPSGAFSEMNGPGGMILFDPGWKFYPGDVTGAEDPMYDDASWRELELPHDWSIEDIPGTGSPLDRDAIGGINTGYFRGGTGWYRKTFEVPANLEGKRICVLFEGVYMDATVWINGSEAGKHPYGYTSFWYDITEMLTFGGRNNITVRVCNEGINSRWYSGSGIYRHVWLAVTSPVHIPIWGTSVTTPEVGKDHATVRITDEIVNQSQKVEKVRVSTRITDDLGNSVASGEDTIEVPDGKGSTLTRELRVESPRLWSPEDPVLYRAIISLEDEGGTVLDETETTFGIRSIRFTTAGFFLNGEHVLLKGGCMHHDNGPLGAAAYDRAEQRRVELMKASGFNSIRCAHNPPSPAFLSACDRLGIMVIDEAFDMWKQPKNPQDYHLFFDDWWEADISSMVRRDRNHPSVIMWSSGNEIPERADPDGVETSRMLADYIRSLDPSRPVTSAVNGMNPDMDPYFATLDVAGYNYAFWGDQGRQSVFETDHGRIPDRVMFCSESFPLTAFGAWMDVLDHPYVIGDFVWTGFDYLGEASIGWLGYPQEGSFYPWNHAYCGDIDICGMKRPQSYYRNVLWNNGQKLSVFVHPPAPSFTENPDREEWSKWHWQDVVDRWNWEGREGKLMQVEAYCAYPRVELFLNGTSLGARETGRSNEWIGRWEVPYEPGTLKAVAYDASGQTETCEIVTAGPPAEIRLSADRPAIRADGQDLCYITAELVDGDGNRNRTADNLVQFEITGPGTILAVASSDPMNTESFQQPHRKAYQGRCLIVLKASRKPGEIRLRALSEGLVPAEVTLVSRY